MNVVELPGQVVHAEAVKPGEPGGLAGQRDWGCALVRLGLVVDGAP